MQVCNEKIYSCGLVRKKLKWAVRVLSYVNVHWNRHLGDVDDIMAEGIIPLKVVQRQTIMVSFLYMTYHTIGKLLLIMGFQVSADWMRRLSLLGIVFKTWIALPRFLFLGPIYISDIGIPRLSETHSRHKNLELHFILAIQFFSGAYCHRTTSPCHLNGIHARVDRQ